MVCFGPSYTFFDFEKQDLDAEMVTSMLEAWGVERREISRGRDRHGLQQRRLLPYREGSVSPRRSRRRIKSHICILGSLL